MNDRIPAPADAVTSLVLAVFRANGLLLAWGDHFAAPLGLTSARWQMVGAIALAGEPLAAPGVAAAMGVTRQGAQKQLDLLVAEGLLERLPNPAHVRSPLHRLTAKGKSTYAKMDHKWNTRVKALARALDPRDAAAAELLLARLAEELGGDLGEPA